MNFSIIQYYGKQTSRCGYCKGTQCSHSHGMHAYSMMPQDYQDLIDRGWRRSGNYCYHPHNISTCCPCYPIKCNALEFKLSKSHKKVLKRMNRFLRDGKKDKIEEGESAKESTIGNNSAVENCVDIQDEPKQPDIPIQEVNLTAFAAANPQMVVACQSNISKPHNSNDNVAAMSESEYPKKSYDSANPPRKKAKQIRLERRQAKLAEKGIDSSTSIATQKINNYQQKTLSEYFLESNPQDKHKLKTVLVHVKSIESNNQQTIYALYKKYQRCIHNDPPKNIKDYLDFLQHSPLRHTKPNDGPASGYGSFHQQYWLDDKLIAVAVIDILPYCISSVYFFYDPDYSFLSLGTYGSLREIEFVQQLAKKVSTLKYYYMGFFIHSCPKMRYKDRLVPSYLACPETYTWVLLTNEIREKLDANKYQRLNKDPDSKDKDNFDVNDLNSVLLLIENHTCIRYGEYIQKTGRNDDRDMILEYGKLVGKTCAQRMLYVNIHQTD